MHILIAILLFIFLVPAAWTQESAAQVTDAQIDLYQRGIAIGCKAAGQRAGDPVEQVNALCDCVLNGLKAEVSRAEWQQAYLFSLRHDPRGEQEIIGPHMQHLSMCRRAP